MTQPIPPTATAEPAMVAGVINAVINAVLGVLLVLSVQIPSGLGGALSTLVISLVAAFAVLYPLVSAWIVRARVKPLR